MYSPNSTLLEDICMSQSHVKLLTNASSVLVPEFVNEKWGDGHPDARAISNYRARGGTPYFWTLNEAGRGKADNAQSENLQNCTVCMQAP